MRDYHLDISIPEYRERIHLAFLKRLNSGDFTAEDGFWELVSRLRRRGIKTALCTSSTREQVETTFITLLGRTKLFYRLEDVFDAVITADDVTHLKPHPEPYLTAAAKLELSPGDCIVLEDTALGVESAKKAGCYCVGLRRPYNDLDRPPLPDFVIDSINELNFESV